MDLVDGGAESAVHDLLLNKKKKMRLGYHAVKCRNQRELTEGASIEKGLENEISFFSRHEYWRRLPSHLWGIATLTDRLVLILQDNIRRSLPKVIEEINCRMAETQKSLASLGTALETPGAQRQQFGRWIDQYLRLMEAAMEGRYELLPVSSSMISQITNVENTRLRAVLRVEEGVFREAINESKNHATGINKNKSQEEVAIGDAVEVCLDNVWQSGRVTDVNESKIWCKLSDQWIHAQYWRYDEWAELKQFIRENRGDELAIFTSYQVFCNLIRQCVDKWRPPAEKLLVSYQAQTKMVSDFVSIKIDASRRVVQFLRSSADDVLNSVVEAANQEVENLLRAEGRPYTQDARLFEEIYEQRLEALQKQLNTTVPVGEDGRVNLSEVLKAIKSAALSTEDREALELKVALEAYLDVAIPRFVDAIPMRLNDFVLRKFVSRMSSLLNGLTDEQLARLMQDSELKIAERQQLREEFACLASAKKEIKLVC
ncbi:putative dynamin central domain, GTPase effector domain, Dynamin superfamily [Plasmopara halstedii]